MIITTTDGVEGRSVTEYLGIVSGGAVSDNYIDFHGVHSVVYEEDELRKAKDAAIGQMGEDTRALGADVVVGVDLDYELLREGNWSTLMVTANGTAVRLR